MKNNNLFANIKNETINQESIKSVASSKTENLNLNKFKKEKKEEKQYSTYYLKKTTIKKINNLSKELNSSNGYVIELLLNEFEKQYS